MDENWAECQVIGAESKRQIDDLRAQLAAIEEREAACCPEDVPFDDYVRSLQKQLAAATERAALLNDEAGRASSDLSFARDENERLLRNLRDAKSDLAATQQQLAAAQAKAERLRIALDRKPDGYAYRYHSPYGGTEIAFNGGQERNGGKPFESIPYYLGQPAALASAQPAPCTCWLGTDEPGGDSAQRMACSVHGDKAQPAPETPHIDYDTCVDELRAAGLGMEPAPYDYDAREGGANE